MSCQCQAPVPTPITVDALDQVAPPTVKAGFLTSEFWATLGVIATNMIGCLVALHYVSVDEAKSLTGQVMGILTALQMFFGNLIPLWQFIRSRTQVKTAAYTAHTQRLKNVAQMRVHAMRLESQRIRLESRRLGIYGGAPNEHGSL